MTVVVCYLVPTIALLLFGRLGNISLTAATLVLSALLYVRVQKPVIDSAASVA
jgi:hypothetical protein